MPPSRTQQLAELVREKRRVLTHLHQVGTRQGELVTAGDVASLLKLLAGKQRLLASLQELEKAIEPYRSEDPEQRVWQSPAHRAACAADADECRRLLAAVVEMEKEHERRMIERKGELASQLQRVHAAHGAADAYGDHRRTPPAVSPALPDTPLSAGIDLTSDA